jgi:hypothetical protein
MQLIYFKDPLYEFIELPKILKPIVDSLEMQRLRRIKQLTGAEYVYPGANHTRFEHSLGTFHLASKFVDQLRRADQAEITDSEELEVQIAALLHDIGHGPFSHTFEEILELLYNKNHEEITEQLVESSEIAETIRTLGLDPHKIGQIATGRYNFEDKNFFFNQLISYSIDSDSLDYLIRDSYHCGSRFGIIDVQRILLQAGIMENWNLGFNVKSLPNLESFLLSRLNSFRTIYFHKTSRGVQLLLVKAIKKVLDELNLSTFTPEQYLQWDDISMWQFLRTNDVTCPIIHDIERRKLPKMIYERPIFSQEGVQQPGLNLNLGEITEEVAQKINLDEEEVLIDTPFAYSVPYYSSINTRPNEIPIFKEDANGKKEELSITEESVIFNLLKDKNIQAFRIYTMNSHPYPLDLDWSFLDAYF